MGIFTRLANWKRYRACKKLQKNALNELKRYDSEKDSLLWRYWNNVYNYWGRECTKYEYK